MSFYNKFDTRRSGKITASQVHILFPKRDNPKTKETYAKHLANEMFFGEIQQGETWQTEHGNDAEYHANNYFTQFYDFNVNFKPEFICKGEFGGTPDAISTTYGIDYKCPTSLEKWLDYIHEGIDHQQWHQCQMYMWLTGLKHWKICAFLIENKFMSEQSINYPVPYENRMIVIDVPCDENWANDIQEKAQPIIEMRDKYFNNLKLAFNGK